MNQYIDYTLLKPFCSEYQVLEELEKCLQRQYFGFCIPPYFVPTIFQRKTAHPYFPKIVTVIGFPFGYNSLEEKKSAILRAIDNGADELDFVLNLSAVQSNQWDFIEKEFEELRLVSEGKILKCIMESMHFSENVVAKICQFLEKYHIDFAKTSTGFLEANFTIQEKLLHVEFLRKILSDKVQIKISGGVRTLKDAQLALQKGATRIGTSTLL